jgi:ketosteroid isomerase-like protein
VSSAAEIVRAFYEARWNRDQAAIRNLLADAVVWRLPAEVEKVEYRTANEVVDSLTRFWDLDEKGELEIEPVDYVETETSVALVVRWTARTELRTSKGYELAVYRVAGGRITEALFLPDFSLSDLTAVFAP